MSNLRKSDLVSIDHRIAWTVPRLLVVALAALLAAPVAGGEAGERESEPRVGDFTLRDFQGKAFVLGELGPKQYLVVAFLSVDCPLTKLYAPRLDKLAAEYADRGVVVVGIDSNAQDSQAELAAFARTHDLRFPLLKDPGNLVADQFGAERTPEVFLLDRQRTVRYRGRIDDQYNVGAVRPEPKQHDLRAALDQLLAGQEIRRPKTEAVGCLIGKVRAADPACLVTYTDQIAPLLERRCVECHRAGQIGPFSLTEFTDVAGWSEMIGEVVAEGRMPPWHADPRFGNFAGDRHLSDDEKDLVKTWVAAGRAARAARRSYAEAMSLSGAMPSRRSRNLSRRPLASGNCRARPTP